METILEEFLASREIPEETIAEMRFEKIDIPTILSLKDEELKRFLPKCGDRIATINFCYKNSAPSCSTSSSSKKTVSLIAKLKDGLKEELVKPTSSKRKSNSVSKKQVGRPPIATRKIQLGWICNGKLVRQKDGGGTRIIKIDKLSKKEQILQKAIELFFPEQKTSSKGPLKKYIYELFDFKQNAFPDNMTVGQMYDITNFPILRFYLATTCKTDNNVVETQNDTDEAGSPLPTEDVSFNVTNMDGMLFEDDSLNIHEMERLFPEMSSTIVQQQSIDLNEYSAINEEMDDSDDRNEATGVDQLFERHDVGECIVTESLFVLPTLPETAEILKITVNRINCVGEVLLLYRDECIIHKKLNVTFKGEPGVDGGGLTKELFSVFFSQITDLYFRGEDCMVPFLELSEMEKKDDYVLIGRALMHMLLLTGTLPSKLSRIALMLIAKNNIEIKEDILLNELINYVNPCLRRVLKKVLKGSTILEREKDVLLSFFQSQRYNAVPNIQKIRDQLVVIANDILVEKPRKFISLMSRGVALEKYADFWTRCDFNVLLDMQKITVTKVLNCLATEGILTNDETDVLHYFEMYIQCLSSEDLVRLIFLITGSFILPLKINVKFSDLVGLALRPTFSTCSDTIVLPRSYGSYNDLKIQLNHCLKSREVDMYTAY